MNDNNFNDNEKIILDRIKKIINDNSNFSLDVAKVEIDNILKENLDLKEKISNIKDMNDE